MPNTMPPADVDTVLAILLREDIDAIRSAPTQPAPSACYRCNGEGGCRDCGCSQ